MLSPCQSFGLDYCPQNTQGRSLHRFNSTAPGRSVPTMQDAGPRIGIPVRHSGCPCSHLPERACRQDPCSLIPPCPSARSWQASLVCGMQKVGGFVRPPAWRVSPTFLSQCRPSATFALFLGLCVPAEGAREFSSLWLPNPSECLSLGNLWSI